MSGVMREAMPSQSLAWSFSHTLSTNSSSLTPHTRVKTDVELNEATRMTCQMYADCAWALLIQQWEGRKMWISSPTRVSEPDTHA